MARPVWSGSLTFGLVSLPVRMYSATDSHTLHFHQIQRGTADRIRNKRVNERTGKEGPYGKEGSYGKVYSLLHKALTESQKAGIATFVMRNREYLVAVKAEDDVLALHTLHWADEVRETLTTRWDPEEYHDEYQAKVRRLVAAKSKGETVEKAEEPPESTNVVDLMSTLQASIKSARADGRRTKDDLESLNKPELYDRATEAGIRGRSSMNRGELIAALTKWEDGQERRKAA